MSIVLLLLTSMLHLTVATHYCGGNAAALKVSLSGKLASCSMEGTEESSPIPGNRLATHCCDDVVTFYAIDSNYTPSFPVVPDFYQYNLQVFNISAGLPVHPSAGLTSLYTNVSLPDALMSTSVDFSDICIFRI